MNAHTPHEFEASIGHLARVLPYPVRQAVRIGDKVVVLLDPDAYLSDPEYGPERRRGVDAIRNLRAYSETGQLAWEAEMPEACDYYYRLTSSQPLKALTFSSYECTLDPVSGRITARTFLK